MFVRETGFGITKYSAAKQTKFRKKEKRKKKKAAEVINHCINTFKSVKLPQNLGKTLNRC